MKSILITFDQAHYENIVTILDRQNIRGFTYFDRIQGRGTTDGEPHFGSHAWPSLNSAIVTIVEDNKVDPLLDILRKLDKSKEQLGLRAFVWSIEKTI